MGLACSSQCNAAQTDLGPPSAFGVPRRAWVTKPELIKQDCPLWCWAASIAMIFARHGHPLPQEQIVSTVFGGLICAAAPSAITMAKALSGTWTDKYGVMFQSQVVAAYDQMAGVNAITNNFIIDELSNDRPLLYANTNHAMVVTGVNYLSTPFGPNVQMVEVIDPLPTNPDFHPLSPSEIIPAYLGGQMTFLAAVHI